LPKLDDQIALLQDRLSQLKLRQQRADARKRALAAQRERKAEIRRNVLVGALVLAKVESGEMDATALRGWLDAALTKPGDRALFNLPPREQT